MSQQPRPVWRLQVLRFLSVVVDLGWRLQSLWTGSGIKSPALSPALYQLFHTDTCWMMLASLVGWFDVNYWIISMLRRWQSAKLTRKTRKVATHAIRLHIHFWAEDEAGEQCQQHGVMSARYFMLYHRWGFIRSYFRERLTFDDAVKEEYSVSTMSLTI